MHDVPYLQNSVHNLMSMETDIDYALYLQNDIHNVLAERYIQFTVPAELYTQCIVLEKI